MLRRRFSLCCVLFLFVFYTTVTAVPPSKEEELRFLNLMDSQLGNIIQQQNGIKGNYFEVKPLQDGGASFINSVYLITTTEGEELIIKIGNPIWKGHKTLNEVLALKFLKENSCIPVPEVFAFENDGEHSLIKAEYIIMPRMKGRPLSSEIDRLNKDKESYRKVLDQLAAIIVELKTNQFSHIGNFISNEERSANLLIGGIVDFAGYEIAKPCKCYSEYARHALNYYIYEMEASIQKGSQDSELYGRYIPMLKELLHSPNFRYFDHEDDQFVFSHQDFVMKNILISGDEVTAILDWEWSGSALAEIEPMTGFDFLQNDEDRLYFATKLEGLGIKDFFAAPNSQRQLFYRLIGNVYTLVAFREWREGKLEHTAKFLSQKLEQRKIRNNPDFDCEAFLKEVVEDLNQCIQEFYKINIYD
jgi:hypothetical protein